MKRLLSLLLVIAMLFGICTMFAACDSSSSVSDKDDDDDDVEPTLVLMGLKIVLPEDFELEEQQVSEDIYWASAEFVSDDYSLTITCGPLTGEGVGINAEKMRDDTLELRKPKNEESEGDQYDTGSKKKTPYFYFIKDNETRAVATAFYVDYNYAWVVEIASSEENEDFDVEEMIDLVTGWKYKAPSAEDEEENEDPDDEDDKHNATDRDVTYAIICRDASNPYMLRMITGFESACKTMGIKCITKSPEWDTADDQIQIINELVAQGVDGIAIAANDAAALEATIKAATDAGVAVVTLDSDTEGSQLFVNQAGVEQVAQVLVDSVYDMTGGEGEFAVLSASSLATNQNAWIAAMKTIIEGDSKYSKLIWVETVYGDDEPRKSTDEMLNLIAKYPNLEVVCCPTTVGIVAAAKVVDNVPNCAVKVAGLGRPSEMRYYVGEGKPCPYMYLWNPIDIGNCAAYMIKALLDDEVGKVGTKFTADNGVIYEVMVGDLAVRQIIVGPPFEFNESNIADWAYVY